MFVNSILDQGICGLLHQRPFLDTYRLEIIITKKLRWCWNWQTGMVEGHVPKGVRVQVPLSAQKDRYAVFFHIFLCVTKQAKSSNASLSMPAGRWCNAFRQNSI